MGGSIGKRGLWGSRIAWLLLIWMLGVAATALVVRFVRVVMAALGFAH